MIYCKIIVDVTSLKEKSKQRLIISYCTSICRRRRYYYYIYFSYNESIWTVAPILVKVDYLSTEVQSFALVFFFSFHCLIFPNFPPPQWRFLVSLSPHSSKSQNPHFQKPQFSLPLLSHPNPTSNSTPFSNPPLSLSSSQSKKTQKPISELDSNPTSVASSPA